MASQRPVQSEGERGGEIPGQLHLEQQGGLALLAIQSLSSERRRFAFASAFARES